LIFVRTENALDDCFLRNLHGLAVFGIILGPDEQRDGILRMTCAREGCELRPRMGKKSFRVLSCPGFGLGAASRSYRACTTRARASADNPTLRPRLRKANDRWGETLWEANRALFSKHSTTTTSHHHHHHIQEWDEKRLPPRLL